MGNPQEEADVILAEVVVPDGKVATSEAVVAADAGTVAAPAASDRTRAVVERINAIHDNWISVPTWGMYMRALGMHTRPVQRLIERSWARRPA